MTGGRWTADDIPDLTGRRALVTGATSGLGSSVAEGLAARGAEVVLAGRSQPTLDAAVAALRRGLPDARVRPLLVDLADLGSVRAAAQASTYGPLHLLVNNAGVMAPPYQRTPDGFELQLATNHLGHFALTGLLLAQLVDSGDGRVVTVSSLGHRLARSAPLGDPRQPAGHYRRWPAYAETKLANLLFTVELERRATAARIPVRALASHPGLSATGLMRNRHGATASGWILQATGVAFL